MKKCVSDKKQIPLLLMSPGHEENGSRWGKPCVILRKPSWLYKTQNTAT